jgi:hypothetical protein
MTQIDIQAPLDGSKVVERMEHISDEQHCG